VKIIQLAPRGRASLPESGISYIFRKIGINYVFDLGKPGKSGAGENAERYALKWFLEKEFTKSKVINVSSIKIFNQDDIDSINKADLLVVGPGGLFLYDTFPNEVSDWQWGISVELLEKIKIPVIVYSLGYNKFRGQRDFNENFDNTVSKLVEKSVFFGLRNTGSCNAIKKHLPQELHQKIKLNYCPTLLFNKRYNFARKNINEKSVGFVLAGDRLNNRHKDLSKYINHIKIFVSYLKKMGFTTTLINHSGDTWIGSYVEFDKYLNLFRKDSRFIYKTYSGIDTVIGDRGHSQMVPFACGCKILTPISHDKLQWFLDDMNLQEFGVEESDENLSDELIVRFNKLQTIDWKTLWQRKIDMIEDTNTANMLFIKQQLKNVMQGS
jgi:polysaccharide pyruvyl transferase WcaK-like protein